jgi:hypothetical protein
MGQAFDEAWTSIAHQFDPHDLEQTAAARVRLAHAVLAVTTNDNRDPKQIKDAALQVMGLTYLIHLSHAPPSSN